MYDPLELSFEEHARSDRDVEYFTNRGVRIACGVADTTTAFVTERADPKAV